MPIETVCQIFYRPVDGYRKAEHLKHKTAEGWRGISSDELRTAVEETSMGLRALGVEKGDRVAIVGAGMAGMVAASRTGPRHP
mgnify:CR=1 FL=1